MGNITEVVATGREYTWKHGRQLASSYYNSATWNYTYNADGMRVKRTSGNKAYTYIYNGDMLRYMEYDSNTTDNVAAAKLYFTFDASGLPISVNYTPEGSATSYLFYYVHNLQGDVEGLLHGTTGNVSVWYSYDAWGNTVVSGYNNTHPGADSLLTINPFRYRSYVYDSETELYYLQSRYYDPEMGRFISSDTYPSTGQGLLGNNMFAYCNNNPVVFKDTEGEAVETVFDVASLILSAVEVATNPTDLGAWVGLLGDAVDLIPFVTGVGESIRVLRTSGKIADGTDAAIDTYRNLRKINKGKGKEVHHILEKRFVDQLDLDIDNTNDMFSIALSKTDHQAYTNQWRKLSYGVQHKYEDVLQTGARIYSNNPKLMAAFLLTLENMK